MIFSETSSLGKLWRRLVRPLKLDYARVPEGVVRDLAEFCFASAATSNEREQGRRDVWLHINQFLQLSEEDLTVIYARLGAEDRHRLYYPGDSTFYEE